MSNVGIPMQVFSFLPRFFDKFDDFSMYIVPMNDDKLIEIIKIIKLGKNLGRNEKTTLEFLCWTFEF